MRFRHLLLVGAAMVGLLAAASVIDIADAGDRAADTAVADTVVGRDDTRVGEPRPAKPATATSTSTTSTTFAPTTTTTAPTVAVTAPPAPVPEPGPAPEPPRSPQRCRDAIAAVAAEGLHPAPGFGVVCGDAYNTNADGMTSVRCSDDTDTTTCTGTAAIHPDDTDPDSEWRATVRHEIGHTHCIYYRNDWTEGCAYSFE